ADIGNSHTTIGLLVDGEVRDHWRVATVETRTADEWFVLLRGLIADGTVLEPGRGPDGIAVCSTVPAVLHEWRDMLTSDLGPDAGRGGRAGGAHRRTGADGQPA